MRFLLVPAMMLLLTGQWALGQSFEMKVHLKTGEIVTVPVDEIRHMVFNGATAVIDPATASITAPAFRLLQNYPNPFNPSTTIVYEIPGLSDVAVRIFDLKGSLIRELVNERQDAGQHRVVWDGTDGSRAHVASGVYLSVVRSGGQVLSNRLILIK